MKILHIIGDCNPAMGGAIEGVLRLGDAYRELGHEQHLLTLDDPGDPWVAECPSPVVALGRPGPSKRFYPAKAITWLRTNLQHYDGVVVDGLWNASTLAAARVLPASGARYCVFPHGMLDPWFRHVQPAKEWLKRQLFRINERRLLRGAKAVLFTSEQERQLARASWPGWQGIEEAVVGFGTGDPPEHSPEMQAALAESVPALGGRPFLLFLSRIHPKKGCEILLEGFASASGSSGYALVIAGPGDPGYVAELRALADRLGVADRVYWPGMLAGDAKWGALHGCEAMILTSYQENFGVVVAEALGCSKPVLISDQVNIHDEVSGRGVGLVCRANSESVRAMIENFHSLDEQARTLMGAGGRALFEARYTMRRVAKAILTDLA